MRGREQAFGEECVVRSARNAWRSLRTCVGAAWGSESAREGRVAVRGREQVFGEECVVRAARNASRSLRVCVDAAWGNGSARGGRVAVRGRAKAFDGECVVWSAGVHRRCEGSGSVREGSVALLGREQIFGGEWVVRSAGLTHFRRSRSRVRVLLYYVRRATAVKSQPWGRKTPPASTHRPRRLPHSPRPRLYFRPVVHTSPAWPSAAPTKTSASRRMMFAPAAATFTLPPRRSHFPRIPFGDAHEDFGLPQQQLSTMGYPRKSYPHRCSPPCAKRSRPRACARVYIIYRSPVGRSGKESAPLCHRVPRRRAQGGGGRRQRRTPPRAVSRTFPANRRAPSRSNPPPAAYRRAPAA